MKLPYSKDQLKDDSGRYLTQSLFLEKGYNDAAIFTFKDEDHTWKGKVYISLKKRYLEHEDPIEYDFATTYLYGWEHWKRIKANKMLAEEVNIWTEELELKLRSQAVKDLIDLGVEDKSFQAIKWLADRGWEKRGAGRPSKQDKLKETRMQGKIEDEFRGDVIRMQRKV